jgi:hypothetical protein
MLMYVLLLIFFAYVVTSNNSVNLIARPPAAVDSLEVGRSYRMHIYFKCSGNYRDIQLYKKGDAGYYHLDNKMDQPRKRLKVTVLSINNREQWSSVVQFGIYGEKLDMVCNGLGNKNRLQPKTCWYGDDGMICNRGAHLKLIGGNTNSWLFKMLKEGGKNGYYGAQCNGDDFESRYGIDDPTWVYFATDVGDPTP